MVAPRPTEFGDWLLAHGYTSVTSQEAAELLDIPVDHVRIRLRRQVDARRMFSPARSLWVPVPPQFRTWGVSPAEYFIDDLMHHLDREYYVGWLSAAEIYGVAHQRPQTSQIAVTSPLTDRDIHRIHLRFTTRSTLVDLPRTHHSTVNGQIWVSTPELTALDLTNEPTLGGGLSNVATVLAELSEEAGLNPAKLVDVAALFPVAAARRFGYLLELVNAQIDLTPLLDHLSRRSVRHPSMLSPTGNQGARNARWNLIVNTDVEPDL